MDASGGWRRATSLLAALLVGLTAMGFAPLARGADAVPGQLIVAFRDGMAPSRAADVVRRVGGQAGPMLGATGARVVRPQPGVAVADLRQRLARHGEVRYAEPDYYLRSSAVPDDPGYPLQYALGAGPAGVQAPSAWDRRTSCSLVATLDSGVQYNHPDLAPDIWHNPGEIKANGKDDDHNGYIDDYYGVNIPKGSGSAADQEGHGTHVAGIIAARGNNALGVSGLCWSGQVMPVRFLDAHGRGTTSDAIAGINYAIHEGAKIINCSFGSTSRSTALEDAVKTARSKGVLLVVAAGNDGQSLDAAPEYPAAFPEGNILTVAATDATGNLTSFSSFGAKSVDLAAPGDGILSTYPTSSYRFLSGTSMAAPLVSAAVAMVREQDPQLSYTALRSAVLRTVVPSPSLSGKTVTGGVLNVDAALAAAAQEGP